MPADTFVCIATGTAPAAASLLSFSKTPSNNVWEGNKDMETTYGGIEPDNSMNVITQTFPDMFVDLCAVGKNTPSLLQHCPSSSRFSLGR